jgi:PST family polysaccharide transporter
VKDQLRNAAILGSGSITSVVVGLITAKAYAVLLGPSGVGTYGLLQALVAFVVPVAGAGVGAALVRDLAFAVGKGDRVAERRARIAGTRLVVGLGAAAASILVLAREPIAEQLLASQVEPSAIVAVAVAVVATLLTGLWVSILNGYRQVSALALAAAGSSLAAGLVSVLAVAAGGAALIPLALVLGATAASCVTLVFLLTRTDWSGTGSVPGLRAEGVRLLGTGIPIAVGSVITGTVQLIIPIVVLHGLGADAVGYFRAAASISIGYMGFLVVAMTQDYYPRLSANADNPTAIASTARQQQRLIVAAGIPIVMIALAGVSIAIPILYSASFEPASDILQMQLIGDLLKLPSWTVAFILIVQNRRRAYVGTELTAALLLLCGVVVGVQVVGLAGVGFAYLVTYLVYYPLTFLVARRSVPLRLERSVQGPILFALIASLAVAALPLLGFPELRMAAASLAAAVSVTLGGRMLLHDVRAAGRQGVAQ